MKEKRYMVKGIGWRKIDLSIVCSVAGLSRGMFSQLVPSLSSEGHGAMEMRYIRTIWLERKGL